MAPTEFFFLAKLMRYFCSEKMSFLIQIMAFCLKYVEEVPYYFSRSSIKFQGHTGWKINDLNPIWVRSLGRWQLSNPSDLPCFMKNQFGLYITYISVAHFAMKFCTEHGSIIECCAGFAYPIAWWSQASEIVTCASKFYLQDTYKILTRSSSGGRPLGLWYQINIVRCRYLTSGACNFEF